MEASSFGISDMSSPFAQRPQTPRTTLPPTQIQHRLLRRRCRICPRCAVCGLLRARPSGFWLLLHLFLALRPRRDVHTSCPEIGLECIDSFPGNELPPFLLPVPRRSCGLQWSILPARGVAAWAPLGASFGFFKTTRQIVSSKI